MNFKGLELLLRSSCFLLVAFLSACGSGGSGPVPANELEDPIDSGIPPNSVPVNPAPGNPAPGNPAPANPAPANPANYAPVIYGTPATVVAAGTPYSFTPGTVDPDLDPLSFSISNKPAWAEFDTRTGKLSGTADVSAIGTTTGIVISVDDGQVSSSLQSFDLTVAGNISDGIVVTMTMPQQYVWAELLDGAQAFVDRSFVFGDIPAPYEGLDFLRTANDDKFVSDANAISFTVDRPVAVFVAFDSRTPVLPGWLADWTKTTDHWNGDSIQTDIYTKNFPAGAVTLGGNEMGYSMYNVAIASLGNVQPPVVPPPPPVAPPTPPTQPPSANSAPTIRGTAQTTATAGNAYFFQPSAADSDGDTLAFSIGNKPSWASFDSTTGRLYGTPNSADVGRYSNIVISVWDGAALAKLPNFSIDVTDISMGSATVSWAAPTTNADGTPLTDLAGYRIYYSKTAGNYASSVPIDNPGVTTYVVNNLSAGTWYFVVTAHDLVGNESAESNVASGMLFMP
ncbi:MAG: putative Ig domain-containing protein [Gammaproteobacteria bacterium]